MSSVLIEHSFIKNFFCVFCLNVQCCEIFFFLKCCETNYKLFDKIFFFQSLKFIILKIFCTKNSQQISHQVSMAAAQTQNSNATVLHGSTNYCPTFGENFLTYSNDSKVYVFHLTFRTI